MKRQFIFALSTLLVLSGCSSSASSASSTASSDTACGDEQYGCAAGTKEEDSSKREAYEQNASAFTPISFDEATELLRSGGSGLIYFGFPDCPWCQDIVPILNSEAADEGVEVLYVRTRDDEKERLYTDEQRDEIAPYLTDYIRSNLMGEPTLYVPLVVAVKDGKVVAGHQGTTEGHDAKEREMTDEEREQTEKELLDVVDAAKDSEN